MAHYNSESLASDVEIGTAHTDAIPIGTPRMVAVGNDSKSYLLLLSVAGKITWLGAITADTYLDIVESYFFK